MRFFMQLGHGMRAMNCDLIRHFAGGLGSGVIMGTRVVDRAQIERHAAEVSEAGAAVLFDPCFYVPAAARPRILDYPYWDDVAFDTTDFAGAAGADFCRRVIDYQVNTLDVTEVILPGRYTNTRSDDWLEMHRRFAEAAEGMGTGRKVYSTVALGPDLIQDRPSLAAVLDEVTNYPVDGVYLLYRPPADEYLTTDSAFLLGLLDIGLTLTLADKDVIVGYANQQDLMLAAVGVRTVASGNFRNVRRFNPDNFSVAEDEQRGRKVWYYDGDSLGEFRPADLSVAYQRFDLRGHFGPATAYSGELLSATNPTAVRWPEPEPFKHYLAALRRQWLGLGQGPHADRHARVAELLDGCHRQNVTFADRHFRLGRPAGPAVSEFRQAVEAFVSIEQGRLDQL